MRKITLVLVVAAACSRQSNVDTALPPERSVAGEIAASIVSRGAGGIWIDSVGGVWMDATGALRFPGSDVRPIGLTAEGLAKLSAAQTFAHIDAGDSLEVEFATWGATRATNRQVASFARRMIDQHSAHRQVTARIEAANGITPMLAPGDTADAFAAARLMARLSSVPRGDGFDREFMGAQVMLHRRMLHDLRLTQPHASGVARRLIDRTLPAVEQHLSAAVDLWQRLGGDRP